MLTKKQVRILQRKIEVDEPVKIPYELYAVMSYYRGKGQRQEIFNYKGKDEYYLRHRYMIKVAMQIGFISSNFHPTRTYLRYEFRKMIDV